MLKDLTANEARELTNICAKENKANWVSKFESAHTEQIESIRQQIAAACSRGESSVEIPVSLYAFLYKRDIIKYLEYKGFVCKVGYADDTQTMKSIYVHW